MSKNIYTPNSLSLPTNIIDALNGTTDIYIENPWWKVPLAYESKLGYDKIMKKKSQSISSSKSQNTSSFYNTPKLLVKDSTGKFGLKYMIEWSDVKKSKKTFIIRSPPMESIKAIKMKNRLSFTPKNGETFELRDDDIALIKIDYIMTKVIEFMFIAVNSNFNPNNNYKNEHELIDALFKHLGSTSKSLLSERYFDLMVNPPEFISENKKMVYVLTNDEKSNNLVISLLVLFSKVMKKVKKATGKKSFDPGFKAFCAKNKELTEIFTAGFNIIPSFKVIHVKPRANSHTAVAEENDNDIPVEDKLIRMFDFKMMFYIDLTKEKNADRKKAAIPTFPTTMLAKRLTGSSVVNLTLDEYYNLFNGIESPKNKMYNGNLFIIPQMEFAIYAQGQGRTIWYIDMMFLKENTSLSTFNQIPEGYNFSDDGEIISPKSTKVEEEVEDVNDYVNVISDAIDKEF